MKKYERIIPLLGEEFIDKMAASKVLIVGVGGVGGYVAESLCRSGVGQIDLCDHDTVNLSNFNRQIIATSENLGKPKVDVLKARMLSINDQIICHNYQLFIDEITINQIDFTKYDYIVDACDTVKAKILLIEKAQEYGIEIITSMGTGNKLDPTKFQIADINKTSVCPLAKVMRYELRKRNIKHVKCLFSTEEVKVKSSKTISSISYMPSIAGLLIAKEVLFSLIDIKNYKNLRYSKAL